MYREREREIYIYIYIHTYIHTHVHTHTILIMLWHLLVYKHCGDLRRPEVRVARWATYMCIYIYIYRERERYISMHMTIYIYILYTSDYKRVLLLVVVVWLLSSLCAWLFLPRFCQRMPSAEERVYDRVPVWDSGIFNRESGRALSASNTLIVIVV